ncbi:3-oxoacyl-reductase [Rhexocercosporidium sp. MPI-PUGE-AT-0058]|nr:3-oxoacyl-reductase [Rhexocercosporidium sp. MPI-PUGE-AT-0058]
MAGPLLKGAAFLTGAATGLGKATAFNLAKHGMKCLALADLNREHLLTTSEAIKSQYPDVEIAYMQVDVRDEEGVNNAVLQAVKRFGRVDVAINFAGIAGTGKATDESEEQAWLKVIDINLNGVWRSQRAELRAMVKQENLGTREGRGNIINVASMYGIIGMPANITASPYSASKHGVLGLTKSDASHYAAQGIRINAICPGYVSTPLLAAAESAGTMSEEIAKTPMKRMGGVDEIADCLVFMASPMASFMTGSSLVVDGGYTIN